jgi:hypothetical protein
MNGTGGNRVLVVPDLATVVVVTTTNFRERDAHVLTDALVDEVLATVQGDDAAPFFD